MGTSHTQRITAVDIAHGRIRIPIGHKDQFPSEPARIALRLKGVELSDIAWNPRFGPDRERSGVLQIGRRLADVVKPDEQLDVTFAGATVEIGSES